MKYENSLKNMFFSLLKNKTNVDNLTIYECVKIF